MLKTTMEVKQMENDYQEFETEEVVDESEMEVEGELPYGSFGWYLRGF